MGLLDDIKSLPGNIQVNAVLRERIQLYEEKYDRTIEENDALKAKNVELEERVAELTAEIEDLRVQLSSDEESGSLSDDDVRVLVYLYQVKGQKSQGRPFDRPVQPNDVRVIGRALSLDAGRLEYHLNRLDKMRLAAVEAIAIGEVRWGLTQEGIAYVIENDLV